MLDLLSNSNDLHVVQKQVHKCFLGISSLMIGEDDKVIGMRSLDKEEVPFNNRISCYVPL